jgi:hypothetical protein
MAAGVVGAFPQFVDLYHGGIFASYLTCYGISPFGLSSIMPGLPLPAVALLGDFQRWKQLGVPANGCVMAQYHQCL